LRLPGKKNKEKHTIFEVDATLPNTLLQEQQLKVGGAHTLL